METPSYRTTNPPGMLRKVAVLFVSTALIALVLMFSALVLAIVLVVGVIAWGYLWWKTRDLRKRMRNGSLGGEVIRGEVIEGEVIEGEVIRVVDPDYDTSASRNPVPPCEPSEYRLLGQPPENKKVAPKGKPTV